MTLPVLCMMTAEPLRGEHVHRCLCRGMALREDTRRRRKVVGLRGWGQLLNMFVFFTFRIVQVPLLKTMTWPFVPMHF
jgi:hypothetical protein